MAKVIKRQKCFLLVDEDLDSSEETLVFLELGDIAAFLDVSKERVLQASSKGYKIKRKYSVTSVSLMVPAGFRKTHIVPKAPVQDKRPSFMELIERSKR